MGAGSSTLTAQQKAILTKRLKEAYAQLTADGLEDDIVKDSMQSEYNKIISTFTKPQEPAKMMVSNSTKELSSLSSKFSRQGGAKDGKAASKFARRRSFDSDKTGTSQKMKASPIQVAMAQAVLAAVSVPILPVTSEDVVDSWDSVSQQPFCATCQMAFKSLDFLDRHTKYSDLHTKNLEKKEKNGQKLELFQKVDSIEEEPAVKAEKVGPKQVEGQHYKLLYTGSKFFWRTQKNIDVDIYLHILPQVVEVISFDPVKHREASRIYLNYYTIQNTLEQLVAGDMANKLKELAQDRFYNIEDEVALREQVFLQRVTTFILQRLQLDSNLGEMKFVEQYGDSDLQTPLMDSAPPVLVPVSLTRRRRTSTEEIEATINSISFDRTAIGESINLAVTYSTSPAQVKSKHLLAANLQTAGRITAAVHAAAQYMSSQKWYYALSPPKQRFVKAVRRVIRQSLVAQNKVVLQAREKTLKLLPSSSPDFSAAQSSRKLSMRGRPREV